MDSDDSTAIETSNGTTSTVPAVAISANRSESPSLPANLHSYSNAAGIPIELYDLLLDFLESHKIWDGHRGKQEQRNRVAAGKRELGQLALVCRSWARICQRKIFTVVALRSQADFRELLSLASHPHSRIVHFVQKLQLELVDQSTPWIHAVCMRVRPRSTSPTRPGSPFPNYKEHYIRLIGPKALDVLKSGPHKFLPRRLLAFSQHITLLVIGENEPELVAVDDMVRLCLELPSLEELQLWNVTWSAIPAAESRFISLARIGRPPFSRKRTQLQRVDAHGCAEPWVILSCLSFLENARVLCIEDVAAMEKLVCAITRSVERLGHPGPLLRVDRETWGYEVSMRAPYDQHLVPLLQFSLVEHADAGCWRINTITLEFDPYERETMRPLSELVSHDWKRFDKYAAGITSLQRFIVRPSSIEDAKLFAKNIEPKMRRLRKSAQIEYLLGGLPLPKDSFTRGYETMEREKA